MTPSFAIQNAGQAAQDEPLFVFGSLMDMDLLAVVLGDCQHLRHAAAVLPGYRRCCVEDEVFPIVVQDDISTVDGLLVHGLTVQDLDRILFFEGPAYALLPREVDHLDSDRRRRTPARAFFATALLSPRPQSWDYAYWQAQEKPLALHIAAETMALYGSVAADELSGALWDGIKARAVARLSIGEGIRCAA